MTLFVGIGALMGLLLILDFLLNRRRRRRDDRVRQRMADYARRLQADWDARPK